MVFTGKVEDEAIEQIRRMCDYELTAGSKVRIMPDVHSGKGCTIGTTMTVIGKTAEKLMPYVEGAEIVNAEVLRNTEELKSWVKKIEGLTR